MRPRSQEGGSPWGWADTSGVLPERLPGPTGTGFLLVKCSWHPVMAQEAPRRGLLRRVAWVTLMPTFACSSRHGESRGVWCRGGRAPAGSPPAAAAGVGFSTTSPGAAPERGTQPLAAPCAAPHAVGASPAKACACLLRCGKESCHCCGQTSSCSNVQSDRCLCLWGQCAPDGWPQV